MGGGMGGYPGMGGGMGGYPGMGGGMGGYPGMGGMSGMAGANGQYMQLYYSSMMQRQMSQTKAQQMLQDSQNQYMRTLYGAGGYGGFF